MFENLLRAAISPAARASTIEMEMAESGAMLRLVEEHLGLGLWRLELATAELFWSRRAFAIYGMPPRPGPVDLQVANALLVPEDRARAAEVMLKAIKDRVGFEYTLRIVTAEGALRVIDCVADLEFNPGGGVRAVFGTVRDITKRAQVEEISTGRGSLLKALLKNVPSAIAIVDRSMHYLAVSDHWLSGHGHRSASDLIGKSHYDVRPEITQAQRLEHQRVLAGETIRSPRAYLTDKNGEPIPQMCTMSPWFTAGGQIGGLIMMLGTVDQDHRHTEPPAQQSESLPTRDEFLALLKELS